MRNQLQLLVLAGAVASSGLWAEVMAGPWDQGVIRFGVLPVNQPEAMAKRFEPPISYLTKETGYDFELKTYPTTGKSGGSPTYIGQIAVRTDSDLQRPEDLVGRRVIGASPSSTSGNLLPSGMLIEKGIDKSSFAAMDFAGGHDKAAQAVLDGRYDAAWITTRTSRSSKTREAGLRASWVHDPVPELPITVNTRYVKPEVLAKVRTALPEMHTTDPAAIPAIDPKYERWMAISWQDYAPVKQTIDAVHGEGFYELED